MPELLPLKYLSQKRNFYNELPTGIVSLPLYYTIFHKPLKGLGAWNCEKLALIISIICILPCKFSERTVILIATGGAEYSLSTGADLS
jgi:hypothetical protein